MIDTRNLAHVLEVSVDKKTVVVEPNVPMDRLLDITLPYGLMPPVVMEFPGITVGGGFSGTSGESSSFKYGLFESNVNSIEIIVPNGDVITASKSDHSDLFLGAASSFGTLGVTTLLELQLIEAKKYVELTYHPVVSMSEAIQRLEVATKDLSNDFVDAILFSQHEGVVCIGRLTNVNQSTIQQFGRPWDPWFYLHAQKLIKNRSTPITETIPLRDYLFRYDRGGFWVGSFAFKYFRCPFNRVTRWFLDDFLHVRVMYHALHQSGLSSRYFVQDVGIPYELASDFAGFLDHTFGYYPVWLCPLSQRQQLGQSTFSDFEVNGQSTETRRLLNFGIWGRGPTNWEQFVEANRTLEHKVQELNGKKWLYAHTYYTEEEFWKIYDREKYDELREKYHATHLPTVYDKVRMRPALTRPRTFLARLYVWFWNIWPLKGLYGLFHAAAGREYLLNRSSLWKI